MTAEAWLEHDFGLYIVNLFDTGQAARVLEHPSYALAHRRMNEKGSA